MLQFVYNINTISTNRISLLCESLSISTTKSAFPIDVPFSGVIAGESSTIVMDLGAARKQITINGIIYEQTVTKFKGGQDETPKTIKLTSYEIAQLIHSYVDSSTFQDDQNINRIVILIPSRVDHEFEYHENTDENTDLNDCKLIPWSWKNREYDNDFTAAVSGGKAYFTPYNSTDIDSATLGITGFIRSFSTTVSGQEFPSVQFQLEFEEAKVIADNFLD